MAASTQRGHPRSQPDTQVPSFASGQAVTHFTENVGSTSTSKLYGESRQQAFIGAADQLQHLRAMTNDFLADCPVADDVVLLTHELAANAVRHSRSGLPGGTFTVRLLDAPGQYVAGEVVDGGSDWDGDLQRSARDASGLYLVLALSTACGVSGSPNERAVWFRVQYGDKAASPSKGKGHG